MIVLQNINECCARTNRLRFGYCKADTAETLAETHPDCLCCTLKMGAIDGEALEVR